MQLKLISHRLAAVAAVFVFAFASIFPPHASAADDDSITAQLTKLGDDDEAAQKDAAQTLAMIPIDQGQRPAVLAGLNAHLFSDDSNLRLVCINAYAHWATAAEIPVLAKVVATPAKAHGMDATPNCWAAAVMGIARIDPSAAATAMQTRLGDFFFCQPCKQSLCKRAELNPEAGEATLRLLKMVDSDDQVTTPLDDAMQMLASDAAGVRSKGASVLQIAVVDKKKRDDVLKLLAAHLHSSKAGTRETYVRAYLHWADAAHVAGIESIIAFLDEPDRDPAN